MAALQGANISGADSRCLDNETSSLSAKFGEFILKSVEMISLSITEK